MFRVFIGLFKAVLIFVSSLICKPRTISQWRVFLPFCLVFSQSICAMSLDRMIVYFDPDKLPRQDVMVTNSDAEKLFLQTEVFKVEGAGTENEKSVKLTNPDDIKLLTSPKKAVLNPGTRKKIRLISLETPKKIESVYRVKFKPVIGEVQAKKSGLKVLLAYEILVFIRPKNPAYKVSAVRVKDKMIFRNDGNINVQLRSGRYCANENEKSCVDLPGEHRIYAGQSWELALSDQAVKSGPKAFVQYGLFDGKNEKMENFPLKESPKSTQPEPVTSGEKQKTKGE